MQSLEAIRSSYAKALLVDQKSLREAQQNHDVTLCQEILQEAYLTDVRPLLERARISNGGALNPLDTYRNLKVRKKLVDERGKHNMATGL
jgi:L-rhamnose isomerase/sugar isomerase